MVVDKLISLSGEDALKEVNSPQNLAARWISDYDGMMMDLDDPGFEQRYVMAVFYFAMDGPSWKTQYGWLGEESVCEWFGIQGASHGCSTGCTTRLSAEDHARVCRLKFGESS